MLETLLRFSEEDPAQKSHSRGLMFQPAQPAVPVHPGGTDSYAPRLNTADLEFTRLRSSGCITPLFWDSAFAS